MDGRSNSLWYSGYVTSGYPEEGKCTGREGGSPVMVQLKPRRRRYVPKNENRCTYIGIYYILLQYV